MINKKLLKKLRSEKNWSQEDLATASGLSHRTIQRVESSGSCSLESKLALSAALDINSEKLKVKKISWPLKFRFLNITSPVKTSAMVLFLSFLIAVTVLAVRNYQGVIEIEIVISDQQGVFSDNLNVELQRNATKVIELHNGYSLELDYFYGITPRLKSQLYLNNDGNKILLHTSNRTSTKFMPVKYKISSNNIVSFISPSHSLENVAVSK